MSRAAHDPHTGRLIVDYAYSLGCLDALGNTEANRILNEMVAAATTKAAKLGLYEQFRMGRRHEDARE